MTLFEMESGTGYFGGARMDLMRFWVKEREVVLGRKFVKFGSPEAVFRDLTSHAQRETFRGHEGRVLAHKCDGYCRFP